VLWAEKPKRQVEIGVDADVSMVNNFFGISDIFNRDRTIIFDPARLSKSGLRLYSAADSEAFLNINFGEKFGLGLFFGVDAAMHGDVSGEFFRFLAEGNKDMREFTVSMSGGASVFADAGLKTAFRFGKLKLGFTPAIYVPLLYMPPPDMRYHVDTRRGLKANISLDASAYTPFPLDWFTDQFESSDSGSSGSKNSGSYSKNNSTGSNKSKGRNFPDTGDIMKAFNAWGLDLSVEAEYALNSGWDLGGSIVSIPLRPSTLRYGIEYHMDIDMDFFGKNGPLGNLSGDKSAAPGKSSGEDEDFFEIDPPTARNDLAFRAFRPLRFDFYANYRPLDTQLIVLRPNIGFSALTVYGYDKACFNAGLEAQLNLKRVFSVSLGTGYREKLWRHGLNLMLNLRVLELDLGVSLQSQDFAGSFRIQGAGAHVGFRLGF
ncbi:MAG: hypothetical protein LBO65_05015, partial [Spirochaetaceae bacterium]|nr:hypothetical protein [Spirochaetaceae bacterium]